ncbi:MAG: DNA polymerase III subunit delta [Puniceicoccales bacterium]|jgi:DNA polymerase-3 subunit delta|nr:DNA polymerase III subunit delta [Puniceicoccales bacterium]
MLELKFFIAGSDRFSVAKRGNDIVRSFGDAEIEVIDSDVDKIAEAIQELQQVCEALRTVSIFSDKKLVWYRNVSFLNDTKISHSEEVLSWLQELQNLLTKLPEVGCLITTGVVDRRQKIIKSFLEICHAEILETPKLLGCEKYIFDIVKQEKKKMTSEASSKFLQRTGNDLAVIDNELKKLLLYTADKSDIDAQDIEAIVTDLRDSDFFETIDLFFCEDVEVFLRGIQRYFLYQEEGRPLLAALQNRVRLLIQLRHFYENDAIESISKSALENLKERYAHICDTGTGSIFTQNPWYLGKLLAIAKKCSLADWVQFQIKLLNTIVVLAENYDRQQSVFENLYFQLKLIMSSPLLSAV